MRILLTLLNLLLFLQYALPRDYYIGMFKRGDFLVAQDNVYKERRPYSRVQAEYGRRLKCAITYFRVVDRLGMGSGPVVRVLKGGLQKKFIVVRIRSGYNLPISVNIYIGCHNKELKHLIPPIKVTKPAPTTAETTEQAGETDKPSGPGTDAPGAGNETASEGGSPADTNSTAGNGTDAQNPGT